MTQPPAIEYSSPVMDPSRRPLPTRFVVFAILGMVIGAGRILLGVFMLLTLAMLSAETDGPRQFLVFALASVVLAAALTVGSVLSLWRQPIARKIIVVASVFDTFLPVMLALGMLVQRSTGYGDDDALMWLIVAVRFVQGLIWWMVYRSERARETFEPATTAQP